MKALATAAPSTPAEVAERTHTHQRYVANLASAWIPALDGVQAKLEAGARVADVGCGHGASTVLMAQARPASTFVGFDHHPTSIEQARKRAAETDGADRCRFGVASTTDYSVGGYDLVAAFDCLHDTGDPVGAAAHVLASLAPDGTWLIVEPVAGGRVEDNLNPVGRAYYGFSTLLCVPNALSQEVGLALGAQAGEASIRHLVTAAGYSRSASPPRPRSTSSSKPDLDRDCVERPIPPVDIETHRAAMGIRAGYLIHGTGDERDALDYNPEFSRRARGFAVYAAVPRWAAKASPRWWSAAVGWHAASPSGTCWMSGTTWQGRAAMRISVSNWSTDEADVDHSVAAILRCSTE